MYYSFLIRQSEKKALNHFFVIIMSFWHNLSKLSGHTSCNNNNNSSSSRSMLDSGVISKSWLASSGGRLIWYTVIILYGSCSKQLVPHPERRAISQPFKESWGDNRDPIRGHTTALNLIFTEGLWQNLLFFFIILWNWKLLD